MLAKSARTASLNATMMWTDKFGSGGRTDGGAQGGLLAAARAEERLLSRACYPSLLSSRIRCKSLKTKDRGTCYPSLKPGVFAARNLADFCPSPKIGACAANRDAKAPA
jgi:hypothetical protein